MSKTLKNHSLRKWILFSLTALLSIYVLVPQLHSFKSSLQTIVQADRSYVMLAALIFTASFFLGAQAYCFISYFKLRFWPTVLVQVADGFTSKIGPVSFGAIATNVIYLMKQSKSGVKAGYIVAVNNILGFAAHIFILIFLLAFSHQSLPALLRLKAWHISWLIAFLCLAILLSVRLFWRRLKTLSIHSYNYLTQALAASLQQPLRLLAGFVTIALITFSYALTLLLVTKAVNVQLNFLSIFIVLTASVFAAVITPTPGGIGGVEASMVAAFVAFGVTPAAALSATLIYRLITFWLPILPGMLALELAIAKGYLSTKRS